MLKKVVFTNLMMVCSHIVGTVAKTQPEAVILSLRIIQLTATISTYDWFLVTLITAKQQCQQFGCTP
jgi:hypothetical protein